MSLCAHVSAKHKERRPLSAENGKELSHDETESRNGLLTRNLVTAFVEGECRIIFELRDHLNVCVIRILKVVDCNCTMQTRQYWVKCLFLVS